MASNANRPYSAALLSGLLLAGLGLVVADTLKPASEEVF